MTDEPTTVKAASSGAAATPTRRTHPQGRRVRLHGRVDPGPRGARGGPPPPGHVHRLDRCSRSPPSRLGGRRQLDRRGDGRPRHPDRRDDRRGRAGDRGRRRPGRPGRQAFDRQGRPRGGPHGPPRRWQVRRRRLQGLRRSPWCRGQRGQRPLVVDAGRELQGRLRLGPGVRPRQGDDAGQEDRALGRPTRDEDDLPRRRGDVRDDRLVVRDDQPAPARVLLPEQGSLDQVHRRASGSGAVVLLRGRADVLRPAHEPEQGDAHPAADLRRAARGKHVGRGRPPVQRHLHRERPRLRQQHQHGRRRDPCHRLPGRAHRLPERLGPTERCAQGQRSEPERRRRPRRA